MRRGEKERRGEEGREEEEKRGEKRTDCRADSRAVVGEPELGRRCRWRQKRKNKKRRIMILPIYLYGHPVIRKVAEDITKDYPELKKLVDDMFETMYKSDGIGIAAPQVGKSIRLFVIDASPVAEDYPEVEGFKRVFINAHITKRSEDEMETNEGCLSLPGINENVSRSAEIEIEYDDLDFVHHKEVIKGYAAIVVQHEYDHLDGKVFIDHIGMLRKRLIKNKLTNIMKGKVNTKYRTVAP